MKVFNMLCCFLNKSRFIEVTKHIKDMKADKCEVKLVEVQASSCSSTGHLIFFHHERKDDTRNKLKYSESFPRVVAEYNELALALTTCLG